MKEEILKGAEIAARIHHLTYPVDDFESLVNECYIYMHDNVLEIMEKKGKTLIEACKMASKFIGYHMSIKSKNLPEMHRVGPVVKYARQSVSYDYDIMYYMDKVLPELRSPVSLRAKKRRILKKLRETR